MPKTPLMFVCLLTICVSALGQTESEPKSGQATKEVAKKTIPLKELSSLGALPVRYNGRLTDLQTVSRRYATGWAKAQKFQGPDNRQYDALQLYILLIARHASVPNIRCFHVPKETAASIGMDPSETHLYSFSQVTKAPKFQAKLNELDRNKSNEELNLADVRFRQVLSNLNEAQDLASSHVSPWAIDSNQLSELLATAKRTSQLGVPRMCFADETKSGRWGTLLDSSLRDFASTALKEEQLSPNPYANAIAHLLIAIRDDNQQAFNEHSATAFETLNKREACTSALDFSVPTSWMETGVGRPFEARLFSDASALGVPIARFEFGSDRFNLQASINHFPNNTIVPVAWSTHGD